MFERLGSRLTGSVLMWDILLTLLCLRTATFVRLTLEFGKGIGEQDVELSWQLYVAVAGIWLIIFLLLTPQRAIFTQGVVEAIGRLVAAVALASLTFAGALYLSVRDVSRLQFLYFASLNVVVLVVFHLIVRAYVRLRQRRSVARRVLIVGEVLGSQLGNEIVRRPWAGLELVGFADDQPSNRLAVPWLGPVEATASLVEQHRIDEVIFALPPQRHDEIAHISLALQRLPVMVHMVPSVLDLTFTQATVETLGGVPLISLRESALSEAQRFLKRVFDIVGSTMLLVLLSPLMLAIAIAIRLDSSGPTFYFQERIGQHGKHFKMIKFRSMYRDADRRWREVAIRDTSGRLVHKRDDDPRVTRIGRKLRRTSLDELPQLVNVLRGEMSLVGPRPEMPYIASEYEPWQWNRFRVPPGMTGWWQVSGRAGRLMHLHTDDDLYYIKNYSFWLDLKILWMTVGVVFRGDGAY